MKQVYIEIKNLRYRDKHNNLMCALCINTQTPNDPWGLFEQTWKSIATSVKLGDYMAVMGDIIVFDLTKVFDLKKGRMF